jgi:hypothetical protein
MPEMSHFTEHPELADKSDWTEQDLLTRSEAGGRVRDEIDLVQSQLAELPADSDAATREHLEQRLRSLNQLAGDLPQG